ncbi:MAG TPA: DUF4180 domain-containing protein [Chitinophaga sp.]|uniref:DUF4180 domain-containing protein n=1 Tax=Chitinophaga sp. TaxID=1869181 RepID=UPI002C14A397|nr:DUF4180 domain-containing protein [Chitinophaga sp.]HVI44234.1 DUF4180 domain-containing protein [Chitinophaga sp.]
MTIVTHQAGNKRIAEIISETILMNNAEEALQLIVDLTYQDYDLIIIHEKNITPEFFDLKTGIAGEILQKFSNYRAHLTIVGEFTKYPGKSIRDFIYESNKGRHINFLESLDVALERAAR